MLIALVVGLWILSLGLTVWITRALGPSRAQVPAALAPVVPPEASPASQERAAVPRAPGPDPAWAETSQQLAFLRDCQTGLAQSIVDGLRSTTEPLTANLLDIRSEIGGLVTQVKTHDRKMATGEDLAWVERLGEQVRDDMAQLGRLTRDTNQSLDRHFVALEAKLATILGISQQIEDLYQTVNVLSINASIEAARAGTAGRGFKVIATEVKSLAQESSTFLTEIENTIRTTRELFAGIGQDLEAKKVGVAALLQKQQDSFEAFRSHFTAQRGEFEALYRAIVEFTDHLDTRIGQISPVVQLHEITVQELENLTLVARDALDPLVALTASKGPEGTSAPAALWTARVRERLTTARELAVLHRVLGSRGETPSEAPAPGAIELF